MNSYFAWALLLIIPFIGLTFIYSQKLLGFLELVILGTFGVIIAGAILVQCLPSQVGPAGGQIFWSIISIFLILSFIFVRRRAIRLSFNAFNWAQLVSLILLFIIFTYASPSGVRYHSSPDSYGFAATTGYLGENFSIASLRTDYLSATGLEKAVFLGQPSPKLESVWHIPDSQLRFAADMILQAGRVGWPTFFAMVGTGFGSILSTFSWLLLLFCVVGAWAISVLSLKIFIQCLIIFRDILSVSKNRKNRKTKNRPFIYSKKHSFEAGLFITEKFNGQSAIRKFFLPLFSILIFATAPWASVYVLEATLTQLWSMVAILFQISLFLLIAEGKLPKLSSIQNITLFSLAPIFLGLTYANGFPLFIYCSFATALLGYFVRRQSGLITPRHLRRLFHMPIIGTLTVLPFAYILIKDQFIALTRNFLGGAGNQPYSLGMVPIWDLLPVFGQKISVGKFDAPGSGYLNLNWNSSLSFISLLLCVGLMLIPLFSNGITQNQRTKILVAYLIPAAVLAQSLMSTKPGSGQQYPYIYARNVTNFIVIGLPITMGVLVAVISLRFKMIENFSSKIIIPLMSICMTLGITSSINLLGHWQKVSQPLVGFSSEVETLDLRNSVIVSETPINGPFGLTLVSPIYYLTDNWEPEFDPAIFDSTTFKVFEYREDSPGKLIRIGTIKMDTKFKGPINKAQMIGNSTFVPMGL